MSGLHHEIANTAGEESKIMGTLSKKTPAQASEGRVTDWVEPESKDSLTLSTLSAFEARGRRYILKEPTACHLTVKQGYYVFEFPEYDAEGYSKSRPEALADLHGDFACRCEGLVNEPDEALTLDAIEARDFLRERVLRVETLA